MEEVQCLEKKGPLNNSIFFSSTGEPGAVAGGGEGPGRAAERSQAAGRRRPQGGKVSVFENRLIVFFYVVAFF